MQTKRTRKPKKPTIQAAPIGPSKEELLAKELEEIKKLLEQIRDKPSPIVQPIWMQPPYVPAYAYPWQPPYPWTITYGTTGVNGGLTGSLSNQQLLSTNQTIGTNDNVGISYTISNFRGN